MKQFLKMTLATIVGIIIASVILTVITFGIIGSLMASSESSTTISEKNSVFKLTLDNTIVERSSAEDLNAFYSQYSRQGIGLNLILKAIENAKDNKNISGIYLYFDGMEASPATVEAMRRALLEFKESGKFIVAYGANYGNGEYHLATVADKILLNPQGTLSLTGLSMQTMFYADLMKKVGVEMEIFKVGTFKSAVEPYIRTDMSEANKLQLHTYADGVWERMSNEMAEARHISVDIINEFANKGLAYADASEAVKMGLIDSLVYRDEVKTVLEKLSKKDYEVYDLADLCNQTTNTKKEKNKIAVVYAVGEIDGNGNGEGIDSEEIARTLLKLKKEKNVKAVVLRVNSPGGSAYGSEQMWHAAEMLKKEKPLVVSMGDYAASGGYYMSCNADVIVAMPNTLTGSIGIFGMIPNFSGASKKVGVSMDGIKTNEYSDLGNTFRPMREDEKALIQSSVNRGYELFTGRCAAGRKMDIDSIKTIAEGRVWSGVDALRIGLVDTLGNLNDAIAIAADLAKVKNYSVKDYPAEKSMQEQLMEMLSGKKDKEERMIQKALGQNYFIYKAVKEAQSRQGIMALSPYVITY